MIAGRPRRYLSRQEKAMVEVYLTLRTENRKAPTIGSWKAALKRRWSLHPLPKAKVSVYES